MRFCLIKAVSILDEIIEIIKKSNNKALVCCPYERSSLIQIVASIWAIGSKIFSKLTKL